MATKQCTVNISKTSKKSQVSVLSLDDATVVNIRGYNYNVFV